MNKLTSLPHEILHYICSLSSEKVFDFMKLKLVSRAFKSIIENVELNNIVNCVDDKKLIMACSLMRKRSEITTPLVLHRVKGDLQGTVMGYKSSLKDCEEIQDEEQKRFFAPIFGETLAMDYKQTAESITDLLMGKLFERGTSAIMSKFQFEELIHLLKYYHSSLLKRKVDNFVFSEVINPLFRIAVIFYRFSNSDKYRAVINRFKKQDDLNVKNKTDNKSSPPNEEGIKLIACKEFVQILCQHPRKLIRDCTYHLLSCKLKSQVMLIRNIYVGANKRALMNRELKEVYDRKLADYEKEIIDLETTADLIADAFVIRILNAVVTKAMEQFELSELKDYIEYSKSSEMTKLYALGSTFDSILKDIEADPDTKILIDRLFFKGCTEPWQEVFLETNYCGDAYPFSSDSESESEIDDQEEVTIDELRRSGM